MKRPPAENVHRYTRNNWHVNGGCIVPRLAISLSVQARWIASQFKRLKPYQRLLEHVKLFSILLYYAKTCVVGGFAWLDKTGEPYNGGQ